MIRLTGRGSPAEDKKMAALARVSVLRGCRRASLKHRARNAGFFRLSVVTAILVWFISHPTRGRGQAESPAFRAPLRIGCPRCAK